MHPTIAAGAVRVPEPRNPDALAEPQVRDAGADRIDATDDLVAGNYRQQRMFKLAVDNMQVGSANAAGRNLDANFIRARFAVGKFDPLERSPVFP
jgi:hypothetical protein